MIVNDFYEAVMAQVVSNTDVVHFDWFNQELEFEEEDIPFNLPAAFLEMPQPIPWQSVGRHKMIGECSFNIILVLESYLERDSNASAGERADALAPDELLDQVTRHLVGFNGISFNTISRVATVLDHQYTNIKEIVIPFKTLLTDTSAKRTYIKREIGPGNITLN